MYAILFNVLKLLKGSTGKHHDCLFLVVHPNHRKQIYKILTGAFGLFVPIDVGFVIRGTFPPIILRTFLVCTLKLFFFLLTKLTTRLSQNIIHH